MGIAGQASAQTAPKVFAPTPPWPPREHFMLWPGPPPGSPAGADRHSNVPVPLPPGTPQRWEMGIRHPYVGVFRAARPNGRAVLVMPGGGYSFVSLINEGVDIANALNALGITVFVLVYRLPGEGWLSRTEAPLQDAQRAMRLIRARADGYGVDPAKIGICGFSAGGHLGGTLCVGHGDQVYQPADFGRPADRAPRLCGADLSSHPVFERRAQQPIERQPARPSARARRRRALRRGRAGQRGDAAAVPAPRDGRRHSALYAKRRADGGGAAPPRAGGSAFPGAWRARLWRRGPSRDQPWGEVVGMVRGVDSDACVVASLTRAGGGLMDRSLANVLEMFLPRA